MISIFGSNRSQRKERQLPEPDRYAVCCPDGSSILNFYRGYFEAVYVVLHPFIRPTSISPDLFYPETYPEKEQILASCIPVSWNEVLAKTTLADGKEPDIGLRTGTLGLLEEYKNEAFAAEIDRVENEEKIVRPNEGQFPELLENEMLSCLQRIGYDW